MEFQKKHFSHEHPLKFGGLEKKNDCNLCNQKMSGGFGYSCSRYAFFLHKLCAEELPEMMEHPLHPQHPLTLHKQSESIFPSSFFPMGQCRVCEDRLPFGEFAFAYCCLHCYFVVDISCTARSLSVQHKSHKHLLSPVLSLASFECHACRTKRGCEGISYMCNTALPTTFKYRGHVHPLVLKYRPHVCAYSCQVCDNYVGAYSWMYFCEGCGHAVHVNCLTKTWKSKTSIRVENLDEANLLHFPMPDDSTSLTDPLMKHMSARQGDHNINREEEPLSHFSHDHPLILLIVHNDDSVCSRSKLPILDEQKNDKICHACFGPILSPFYGCSPCNFFLHEWCSKFPNSIQHPCHQHKRIFLKNRSDNKSFGCDGCGNSSKGFAFHCAESKDYSLHVKCALLPSSIKHEVHEHSLVLKEDCSSEGCAACFVRLDSFSYGCGDCSFSLHCQCAMLPRKIKHRYDKHPFNLTYARIKDGDEYYCEFCEEANRTWFYHCIDCDQSACVKCIYVEKEWGHTFAIHPHPLTWYYITTTHIVPCDHCHQKINFPVLTFRCRQCKIILHYNCVRTFKEHA